jgi:hypothetical protein
MGAWAMEATPGVIAPRAIGYHFTRRQLILIFLRFPPL